MLLMRALGLFAGLALGVLIAAAFDQIAPGVLAAQRCAAHGDLCLMEVQP